MSETPYNPGDPLFLFSRSLDEDLPEYERFAEGGLDEALAASPSLRAQAEEFRALDLLLRRWARQPVELDWEHHAALIKAQAESSGDVDELAKVARLVKRWGRRSVSLDAEAFTASVMAKVAPKRGRIIRSALLLRLGAPLAAAAAVALAVTGTLWFVPSPEPFVYVAYEPRASAPAASVQPDGVRQDINISHTSRVVVSFARTPHDEEAQAGAPSGISFGSVGSAAVHSWAEELPPI